MDIILSGNIFKYLSVAKNYADIKSLNINRLHLIIMGEVKTAISFKLGLSRYNNRLDTDWLKANKLIEALKLDSLKYQLPWYLPGLL